MFVTSPKSECQRVLEGHAFLKAAQELIPDLGTPSFGDAVSAQTFVFTWTAQSDVTTWSLRGGVGGGGSEFSEIPTRSVWCLGCSGRSDPHVSEW